MATDTGFGRVTFFDDFVGDTLDSNAWSVNRITGGTNFAIGVAVSGTVVGTAHTTAAQGVLLIGELNWQADDGGPLIFETRAKIGTTLGSLVFLGFTDAKTAEMAMDYNGGSYTSTATDAVGFYYAGGETAATWRCGGVKNGTDSTQTAAVSGHNPVLDTYQTFRIVVNEAGDASFYIDGDLVVENVEDCVTAGTSLLQEISIFEDTVDNGTLTADYIYVSKGRV